MKNITLFSILLICFMFVGCGKDGDDELTCGERLEGTWRATSITLNGDEWLGPTKIISELEIELSNFSIVDAEGKARITFQANGQAPSNPIEGIYEPNNSCSRVTIPDFWANSLSTFNLNIEELDEEALELRINYIGSGSTATDGNLVFELEKV